MVLLWPQTYTAAIVELDRPLSTASSSALSVHVMIILSFESADLGGLTEIIDLHANSIAAMRLEKCRGSGVQIRKVMAVFRFLLVHSARCVEMIILPYVLSHVHLYAPSSFEVT